MRYEYAGPGPHPDGEGGIVRPLVERSYPLADAAEAHRRLESDAVFGKLVLRCDEAADGG